MLTAIMPKPDISVIGPGRLGTALARALHEAGYTIEEIVYREGPSARSAKELARELDSKAVTTAKLSDVVILCVGDSQNHHVR